MEGQSCLCIGSGVDVGSGNLGAGGGRGGRAVDGCEGGLWEECGDSAGVTVGGCRVGGGDESVGGV